MTKKKTLKYLNRVLISFDMMLNVILGGELNQTFSARSYLQQKRGKFNLVWLIDLIFFWDPSHCMSSYITWLTGKNIRKVGNIGVYSTRGIEYNVITNHDKKEIFDENFD